MRSAVDPQRAQEGLGGEFPLVGREAEVRRLGLHIEVERESAPATLLLRGEAGVGKSRLLAEAAHSATSEGMQVFHGRAFSLDSGMSYAVLADAFVPFLRGLEGHKLQTLTRGRLPELYSLFPTAAEAGAARFAGVGSPDETRITLFWSFSELLRNLAARAPVLVVAEDLQWADPSAIQLLHFAIRQLVGQPVRFICSSTDGLRERNPFLLDFETSLAGAGLASTLDLAPLSEGEVRALVSRAFSAPEEGIRGFAKQLFAWSRGNPLFATEALRALVDGGHLTRRNGTWIGWEAVVLEAPKGVRNLVASRLTLLSRPAQRVAEAAAVMGERIRFRVLRQVTELSEEETLAAIDELRTRGILREEPGAAAPSLGFTHPLIRDCVYAQLGTPRARLLHRSVAEALERSDGNGAADHAEELAYHFHRSGEEAPQGKALGYLLVAGQRALDRRADEEAARHLRAALDLVQDGKTVDGEAYDRIELTAGLGRALNRVGRYDEAIDLYKRALREDRGPGARRRAAPLRERLGLACFFAGRYAEALDHYSAGLDAATDDPKARGRLLRMRGACLQELARWEEASRDALEALALAESQGDAKTRVGAHQLLTLQHTWTGSPALAREHGWQAIRGAEAAGDLSGAFEAHISLAMTEGLTGNLPEMRRRIEDARALAEKLRSPILHLRVDEISLQEAHATGAWSAAVALGEDAVARARSLGQRAMLPRLLVWTALPLLGRGQVEKASAMVSEAWALAGLGPSGEGGPALDLHAVIPAFIGRVTLDLTEGNVAAAQTIAERGLEMADRSGAAIWSLHHLIPLLGQAYLLARDLEGAERLERRLRRDATRMDHVLGLAWADACDALVTWLGGDIEGGCTRLRAAADRLDGIPMAFDAARVRRQFAGRLADLGRVEEALVELRRAHAVFNELGAESELEATRGMFKELEVRPPPRASAAGLGGLTGRELEVSRLVAARRSNKAIAKELRISDRTVTTHLTNIYRKLHVGSRGELVDFVRERGWAE